MSTAVIGCGISVPENDFSRNRSNVQVLETTRKVVKQCKLLGIVENSSILGGGYGLAGLQAARETAIDRARVLGATHIVWVDVMQGDTVSPSGAAFNETIVVNGAAYYCETNVDDIDFVVKEKQKNDTFEYSEAYLRKKDRMKLISGNAVENEVAVMPETLSNKDALKDLPETTFKPREGSRIEGPSIGYGEEVNIDDEKNPFE